MITRILANLALVTALLGCSGPSDSKPAEPQPSPVQVESQEFACEQLRSGSTLQELLDHEQQRGVDDYTALNYAITSINQTCPEFFILIEGYFSDDA